ncbi:MAG: carbohydrate-binding domain-containing protein [Lachnospiraceae bacterium]|nr:carbohydrate-binding domain-containing protein [Lachnospiraceae bacterium]
MRRKPFWICALILSLTLAGCNNSNNTNTAADKKTKEKGQFTKRDLSGDYDESKAETLSFSENSIETSSKSISVKDTTATIKSDGLYILSGTCDNGMVVVDAAKTDKIQIVLKDVSLKSQTSAAIYVKQADKVFLTLADGTKNTLGSGSEYIAIDENNIDGAIFSKDDLTINGTGSLDVESQTGHGIVGKDDLVFANGSYSVNAAKDAVSANDSIRIADGNFKLHAEDDAFHCDDYIYIAGGEFEVEAGDDAFHADKNLTVEDGKISVTNCYEGLEAQVINISGGEIDIVSSDDGVNAAGGNDSSSTTNDFGKRDRFDTDSDADITISGGVLHVSAEGDGLDSNGNITVSGGEIYITGPEHPGNASLDYGIDAVITGGKFVAAGAAGMAENFGSKSTQGCILINTDEQKAGTGITLADVDGNEMLTWVSDKTYSCVVISLPEIKEGRKYTLKAGSFSQEITMDSLIYGTGNGMGFGGGHGGQNHQKRWGRGRQNQDQMPNKPEGSAAPDIKQKNRGTT